MKGFRALRNTFSSLGKWWAQEIKTQESFKTPGSKLDEIIQTTAGQLRRRRELCWIPVGHSRCRAQRRNAQGCRQEQENTGKPRAQWYLVSPDTRLKQKSRQGHRKAMRNTNLQTQGLSSSVAGLFPDLIIS